MTVVRKREDTDDTEPLLMNWGDAELKTKTFTPIWSSGNTCNLLYSEPFKDPLQSNLQGTATICEESV